MIDGGLHQQPGHADHIGLLLLGRVEDDRHRLLDAEVDHLVAVVGQDDVDEVLADVVHVALDRGQHDAALDLALDAVHVRLQVGHRGLHHLGRLEHERQLHLTGAEQLADGLHAVEQHVVDDLQGRALRQRLLEIGLQALALTVHDAALEPLPQGQAEQLRGPVRLDRGGVHAFVQLHEPLQRVVTLAPPVVDHVQRDLALLLGNARHRQDLGGVHDGRVQARVDAFVQEHAVEHDAGGRVEPEGDVGQTQDRLHARVAPLELGDRLDRLQAVAAGLLLAGGDREGEGVDEDVLDVHAPVVPQVLDQPAGHPDLPVGRAGLALLVDGQGDHGRAVLADQRHDLVEARVGAVAVLVVDRVDHRAAAQHLQARLAGRAARWSPGRSAAWRRWRSGTPAPSCRPRRRGRRSRCTGRACARRRGPGPARSPRTPPSSAPASPRGRPWSRWRWCARRWPGRRCPGGRGRSGTARPRRPRGAGGAPRSPGRAPARPPGAGARGWCRSSRRPATGRSRGRRSRGRRPAPGG